MKNKDKIWNGGTTFGDKFNKMIRESEDYLDGVDITPMKKRWERKNQINKNMDKPCDISGGRELNQFRKPEGSRIGTLDNRDE